MSSSELSNALNPNSVVARPRRRHGQSTSTPLLAAAEPFVHQPPIPHRSELELAIVPPEPTEQQAIAAPPVVSQPPRNANPVLELYRVVATAREAAAAERQRRLAWEQEQEAKAAQHQLALEQQVLEMRQEITMLRAYIGMHPNIPTPPVLQPHVPVSTIPTTAHIEPLSPTAELSPQTPLSPISPVLHHSETRPPMFVEGSSSHPLASNDRYTRNASNVTQSPGLSVLSPAASTAPSPQVSPPRVVPSVLQTESLEALAPPTPQSTGPSVTPIPPSPKVAPNPRKRSRQATEDESDRSNSESEVDSDDPSSNRALEGGLGSSRHCSTIHHAMRIHIRKMMKLKRDEDLPDSHFEGAPLLADQPVRFVWGKTPKQSAHNAAMKRRVVNDIKANRNAYKHVGDKEFLKKTLDSAFDQVFTTLRQKFKAQSDTTTATRLQRRENHKALKARRLQRKKAKLGNRADARAKLDAFAQPVFAGALHQDCMSSEESDGEFVDNGERVQVFRTRGPSWRSARLLRFYAVLDNQDRVEKSVKPKRGGRRERREGPPKDGLFLPPKGVARWMVSRRWLQETEAARPDLVETLRGLIVDAPEQENEVAHVLLGSDESEDEATRGPPAPELYAHVSDTSYSLHNALQPV